MGDILILIVLVIVGYTMILMFKTFHMLNYPNTLQRQREKKLKRIVSKPNKILIFMRSTVYRLNKLLNKIIHKIEGIDYDENRIL